MDEVINYVMDTPGNTNPNVLRSMLEKSSGNNRFVVTLTPTEDDFSGVMDRTPQEITAAYHEGRRIVFDIPTLAASVEATQFMNQYSDGSGEIAACANVTYEVTGIGEALIKIITWTGSPPQGVTGEYVTSIYPLTTVT